MNSFWMIFFKKTQVLRREINVCFPVDTGRKLNVRRTFVFWTTYLHSFYVLCLRGCEEIFTMDEIKRLNGLFFFLYQVLSNLKVHQMFQQPFLTSFCILHNLPIENPSPDYHRLHYFQKHPSRGVLRKRCSENMQKKLQENIHAEVWFQ